MEAAADSSEYSDRRTAFSDMLAELEDGRAIAHASREFLEIVEKLKVAAGLAGKAKGKIAMAWGRGDKHVDASNARTWRPTAT